MTAADTNNQLAGPLYKQAETATEARDNALGPDTTTPGYVRFFVTASPVTCWPPSTKAANTNWATGVLWWTPRRKPRLPPRQPPKLPKPPPKTKRRRRKRWGASFLHAVKRRAEDCPPCLRNHAAFGNGGRFLECDRMTSLSLDATCCVEPKRGRVRALQSRIDGDGI